MYNRSDTKNSLKVLGKNLKNWVWFFSSDRNHCGAPEKQSHLGSSGKAFHVTFYIEFFTIT